ncbi:hypothetical protein J6A31_09065 [bacterium]|nr:hypothetical protein [bacterium]
MLGFLSPSGKFHECNYYGHLDLANTLLQTHYHSTRNDEVETLCDLGWVVIQSTFIGFAGNRHRTYTLAQEQWFDEHYNKLSTDQKRVYDDTRELSDLLKCV